MKTWQALVNAWTMQVLMVVVLLLETTLATPDAHAGIWDWFKGKKPDVVVQTDQNTSQQNALNEDILLPLGKFEKQLTWSELKNLRIENINSAVTVIPTDADHATLTGHLTGKKQEVRLQISRGSDQSTPQLNLKIVYPYETASADRGGSYVRVNGRRYSGKNVSITTSGGKSTVIIDGKVYQDGADDAAVSGEFAFTLQIPRGLLKDLQIEAREITVRDWLDAVSRRVELQFASELTVKNLAASLGLSAESTSGDMELRGIRGPVELENTSGSILAQEIDGTVVAETTSGSIELREAHSAWVESSSGAVRVQKIKGDLRLETTSGSQKLKRIQGHVAAESRSGTIQAREVVGDFNASTGTGRVEADTVGGNVILETETGAVTLSQARGHVRVVTATGKIQLNNPDALSEDPHTRTGRVSGRQHAAVPEFVTRSPQQADLCRRKLQKK